jgi:hypothetical protein
MLCFEPFGKVTCEETLPAHNTQDLAKTLFGALTAVLGKNVIFGVRDQIASGRASKRRVYLLPGCVVL